MNLGITFTVYGHEAGTEKIWPFDVVPRVVEAAEWDVIERGLKQRITALNLFINDVYNKRQIIKDGVVPEYLLQSGQQMLFAAVCRSESAAKYLGSHYRHRFGARHRRTVLRVWKTTCVVLPAFRTCWKIAK